MGKGHMVDPPCGMTEWQTHVAENITFLQIRW